MTPYERLKRQRDRQRAFGVGIGGSGGCNFSNNCKSRVWRGKPLMAHKFKMYPNLPHNSCRNPNSSSPVSAMAAVSVAISPPPLSGTSPTSFSYVTSARKLLHGGLETLREFRQRVQQQRRRRRMRKEEEEEEEASQQLPELDSLTAQRIELEVQLFLQQKDGTSSLLQIAHDVLRPAAQGLGRGLIWDSLFQQQQNYFKKQNQKQKRILLRYQFLNSVTRLMEAQLDNPVQVSSWGEVKEHLSAFMIFPPPILTAAEEELQNQHHQNAEASNGDLILEEFMHRLAVTSSESLHLGLTPSQRKLQSLSDSSARRKLLPEEEEKLLHDQLGNDVVAQQERDRLQQAQGAYEERRKSDVTKQVEQELQELELKEEARLRASELMRPLDDDEKEMVREAIYGAGPDDEILAQEGADSVQRSSMRKLRPGAWLNDEAIHYFFVMLAKRDSQICEQATPPGGSRRRSHFFKSFFITKLLNEGHADPAKEGVYEYKNIKRWTKKVPGKDIFALDKIFFPINVGKVHWVCAVIYMQEKRIQFYDSLGSDGMEYLEYLFRFLQDEHLDKKGTPLPDQDQWKLIPCAEDTPHQLNGSDCGVFTCMFADFLSKDCPLLFDQSHIHQCRERIALSILMGRAIL